MRFLPLLLIVSFHSVCASAQTLCTAGGLPCHPAQVADLSSVFELLSGSADGQNRVFHLTYTPSKKVALHLFRNGIELTPSSDYTVQDAVVTLTGRVLETAGDSLKAAYAVDVTQALDSPSREIAVPAATSILTPPVPSPQMADKEILSQYLAHALNRELNQPVQNAAAQRTVASPKVKTGGSSPASLRMLGEAIVRSDEKDSQRRAIARKTGHSLLATDTDSADRYVPSPYDFLASTSGGLDQYLNSLGAQSDDRSVAMKKQNGVRTPRALILLRQKLSGLQ